MDTSPRRHPRPRASAEDRRFLDTLVFLRRLYARRGEQDREPIESVASVTARAIRLMNTGGPASAWRVS